MIQPAPVPHPPKGSKPGPATVSVSVKFETFYPVPPITVQVSVRAGSVSDALEALEHGYGRAVLQLQASPKGAQS